MILAKRFSPICVTWNDAHGSADAAAVYGVDDVPHGAMVVKTYGILLRDDAEGISLAAEWIEEQAQVRGHTFIDRAMILDVTELRPQKKRRQQQAQGSDGKDPAGVRQGKDAAQNKRGD